MKNNVVPSFYVLIHVAGDFATAKQVCRERCFEGGLCVTVTPTTYVYSGGEEEGVTVRLVNYPRFPSSSDALMRTARELAERLRFRLCQWSFLIESPIATEWVTYRPEEAQ